MKGDPLHPVRRARLELDRTLRSRRFVGRAVRGALDPAEYLDLVSQLGALAFTLSPDAQDVVAASNLDARALREPGAPGPAPCATVCLTTDVFQAEPRLLTPETTRAVALALMGTSWCRDAADRLEGRFGSATRTLDLLASWGPRALRDLEVRPGAWSGLQQQVYAFTELARGAVLGLVTYLDSTWPSTLVVVRHSGAPT